MNSTNQNLLKNISSFTTNYWVFKSVSDNERSYRSIEGYDDNLISHYEYDSNVANNRQVKEGDIVIIINKENILGFAKISTIQTTIGQKEIRRCPVCGTTNYETRKNKTPLFRCNRKHEFDKFISERHSVTRYRSIYGNSFTEVRKDLPISILRPFYINGYNRNMSIQALGRNFFTSKFPELHELLVKGKKTSLLPTEALTVEESVGDYYNPNDTDERTKTLAQIKARRGQRKFRDAIRKRYGNICMVTGCDILDILEAAHINPYKGEKDNNVLNGLLLRSDIHTLFDLHLIGVDPESLIIHINDSAKRAGYEVFHNQVLKNCYATKRPSIEALEKRWKVFATGI